MHIQSELYSRSVNSASGSSNGGGVDRDTVVFIVVGVACLLLILAGFYVVSRQRPKSNVAPSVPGSPPRHSLFAHSPRPRRDHDLSEFGRTWKIWRQSDTSPPVTADTPTLQVSPTPATTITSSQTVSLGDGTETDAATASRPSQARRITSLSVATSFSHSHITEEDLNNFRLSAYDLDGDLETEMLNSATDDVWPGRPLVLGEGHGGGAIEEEAIGAQSDASDAAGGSVEGHVPHHAMEG